jgi:serine/threonine-protein kinase HipA
MMEPEILSVRLQGLPVGILRLTQEREMRFDYLEGADKPISLSMPLTIASYGNAACETYFGGLLPEREQARKAISRQYNVNPNSTFGLLSAIGQDCAGAISFHAPNEPVEPGDAHETIVKKISDKELEKHIVELPEKPLFVGIEDLRLSLAGMQEKAAVCLVDDKVCLALQGTATTHILKPAMKNYPATVQNEFLCMTTATRLGLPVAKVQIRQAKSQIYLLVARYDRRFDKQNKIHRLHQEDFCQALQNMEKYERYYGPGLKDCFELTFDFNIPVVARNLLMEAVVFNFIMGNNDAHVKNFSVLYDERRAIKLAPLYDLLCTQVYEDWHEEKSKNLSSDMSMKIGENYLPKNVTAPDWEKLCLQVGFSFPMLKKIVDKQAGMVPQIVADERKQLKGSQFDDPLLNKIVSRVKSNCARLERLF